MNKKTALGILTLCLISTVLGAMFVYATSPTSTMVLSGGPYPGSPDYTVFNEDGTYYAKNVLGTVTSSGSNCSDVIMDAIDLMTNGGTIHFESGRYQLDTRLDITQDNLVFEGSGPGNTIFWVDTDFPETDTYPVLSYTGLMRFRPSGTLTSVESLKGTPGNYMENLTIRDFSIIGSGNDYVPVCYNIAVYWGLNYKISNIRSDYTQDASLYLWGSNYGVIENCWLEGNPDDTPDADVGYSHGVLITGNNTVFKGNYFRNAKDGIGLFGSWNVTKSNTITGCVFDGVHHGIVGNYALDTTITGNVFNLGPNGGGRGVSLSGTNPTKIEIGGTITGNIFNAQKFADLYPLEAGAESAIRIENFNHVVVSGNQFYLGDDDNGCGYGVLFATASYCTLTGNQFLGGRQGDEMDTVRIRTTSWRNVITGNVFEAMYDGDTIATNLRAIRIMNGTSDDNRENLINSNVIIFYTVGIQIDGTEVRGTMIHDNMFQKCTTTITDNGYNTNSTDNMENPIYT